MHIQISLSIPFGIGTLMSGIPYHKLSQNFTVALEALLLGQLFMFWTIFQPWALSSDISAVRRGLFTKYSYKCMYIFSSGVQLLYENSVLSCCVYTFFFFLFQLYANKVVINK